MIKAIEFPDKTFATKEDLFAELKANENRIIDLKKSIVYKSCDKGLGVNCKFNTETIKGIDGLKDGYIYPIISTTRYKDSHNDVHFDGCFTKTVKEQQGKVHYTLDHELKWDSIITWKEDVKMFVQSIDWNVVGKQFAGQTESLIFGINKDNIKRKDVLAEIEKKPSAFENSIRMIYVKITLGLDSQDKKYSENKKYYDSRIESIANKDIVKEQGYFFGVEELKIWREGSLVVAGGSNDATSIYIQEPSKKDTQEKQPLKNTVTVQQIKDELTKQFKNLKN